MRQAVCRYDAPRFSVSNGGVVNDGVEAAKPVDLLGYAAGFGDVA
jgi:hypothetical protein